MQFDLFLNVGLFFMNPRDSLSEFDPKYSYSDIYDEDTSLTGSSERDRSSVWLFVLILNVSYFPLVVLLKIRVLVFLQDVQFVRVHSFEPEIPIKHSIHPTVMQFLIFPRFIFPLIIVE